MGTAVGQATGLREVYIIISTNLILKVTKQHKAVFEIFTFESQKTCWPLIRAVGDGPIRLESAFRG